MSLVKSAIVVLELLCDCSQLVCKKENIQMGLLHPNEWLPKFRTSKPTFSL